MQSKALLFGFVAAASAQTMDNGMPAAEATPASTTIDTDVPLVTADPSASMGALVNGSLIDAGLAAPSSSSSAGNVTWSWFNTTVTSTVVVAELVTFCPAATTLSFNGVEYTATDGETVTVTNCPCTLTTTLPTITSTICPGSTGTGALPTAPANTAPVVPPVNNNAPGSGGSGPASVPGVAAPSTYVAPSAPTSGMIEVSGASSFSSRSAFGVLVAAAVVGVFSL
ncbi:hypothetical protein BJ166DRAFT_322534 [Pestalotiopsis sp. NC0098]|nr:hypothetical protein BJ166DRAFT_322534 [Pestalotiopsis sp. NC0098]